MVAVEQPRADCGHVARLTQQCGKCLRWCCPECYAPWTALACAACRAEARAAPNPYAADSAAIRVRTVVDPRPAIEVAGGHPQADARCQDRFRARGAARPHRHRGPTDV